MDRWRQDLKTEYGVMQLLLLVLAASIAVDQTLMGFMVCLTMVWGVRIAFRERKMRSLPVWPRRLKVILFALAAAAYLSLHSPLVKETELCTFNYFYVVGQYAAVVWLYSRFAGLFSGRRPFSEQAGPAATGPCGTGWYERFRSQPFLMQILQTLGAVATCVVLIGIAQHITGVATERLWVDIHANPTLKTRVYSTWENPNILAGYLSVAAAYLMSYISVTKPHRRRWMLFAGLVLLLVCQVYTFSRGFWAATAVEVIAFVFFFYRKGIWYLLGVIAAGATLAGPAIWHRMQTLKDIYEDSSAVMRLAYLDIGQAIIRDHPFGVGWYNYRNVFPEYDYYFKNPDVIMYHCHNMLMNITAETGIQGLVLFLVAWLSFLVIAWQLNRKGRRFWLKAFGRGYLLMSLAMFVGGLGDHVFFNVRMGVLFWLLSTILVLCREFQKYGDLEPRK